MRIALISDIHDNTTNLLLALARAQELGCTHLFCMGDVAELSTFRLLCEEWTQGADIVFGNNEWPHDAFLRVAREYPHVTHHGEKAELNMDGRHLSFSHYPRTAFLTAEQGGYDAIFFGHTHVAEHYPAKDGMPLFVNPGELQGRSGKRSMAVYDTADNTAQLIPL